MNDVASFENNDKFLKVEERMNHILNRDEGIKTNYSELRNFYSIICNDIKGAISRRLTKVMVEVNSFNNTYIKGKTPKKDKLLSVIEHDFNEHLQTIPDINPQNVGPLYQFLRELMPIFIQIKSHTAKLIIAEKKLKKIKQHETVLHTANLLSRDVHNLFVAILQYSYFDQYLISLIRCKVNRDHTKELVLDIHAVVKQTFKTKKNESLNIQLFQAIEPLTQLIRIRLGIYKSCDLYDTYTKILKNLPRQLVQQFNARYLSLRRDSGADIEELKDTAEYKEMTKKFITLKLKKYYNLLRLYQINVNRLFIIDERVKTKIKGYIEKAETNAQPGEKTRLLQTMKAAIYDAFGKSQKIESGLPRNKDLKKNSIQTLFSFMISYYHNVLKDTYKPLSAREIAIRSMKLVKPPKEMMLSPTELTFLESNGFKRDEKILSIFFQGILLLIAGEEEDAVVVDPVMKAIGENIKRARKMDLREKAINRIVAEISPVELDLMIQIFDTIPRDQERINTDLGKLYLEISERYPGHLKHLINRAEKVEPTDPEKEKIRKIVSEKYDRLLLKSTEVRTEIPSPVEYLKKVQEEEQTVANEKQESMEMAANYNISSLITHWKNETEKTVIGMLLPGTEKSSNTVRHRDLSRREVSRMNKHFSSEQLGEIDKHYKTLSENIGQKYLKLPRPYSKTEYILLYAAKRLLVEFRNPAKSYPRLHERLAAISAGK